MNDVNAAARMTALVAWLNAELGRTDYRIEPASADASFRRYFRITLAGQTSIVMDAPPEQEDCRPFVRVAALLADAGVAVPRVLAQDLAQGFLLLSDVGRQTYLDILDEDNVDPLLRGAGDTLIKWQLASKPAVLPVYDRALLERELRLFPDWYIDKHMQTELSAEQQSSLQDVFTAIVNANLAQANVYVHRDYMPRNLMVSPELPANVPAVLDFQDAVYGPISYDIACLYKDAFISWDEERVLDGTIRYWEKAKKAALPVPPDFGDFYRDVEWMGLQRHLKVLGIFARINYRDGKPKYLADTPRFVNYVRRTGERYTALFPLIRLFDKLKIDDGRAKITGYTF
ncbi:MAG TPA: phosphotransferase [Usitatibacteraceae bacterium]